jgi:hypothetical protein
MSALYLCADKECSNKETCFRYTADPIAAMKKGDSVRIESTLKGLEERVCSKYWPIKLINLEIKTRYETGLYN